MSGLTKVSPQTIRIAINGFGRIGRSVFRLALAQRHIEVVAINDLAEGASIAHQLKYDSTLGSFPGTVEHKGDHLVVNGRSIRLYNLATPEELPWGDERIDVVIEATGRFTTRALAAAHLAAGARKVIISAPSADADLAVVLGVNHQLYDPTRHNVISNASCTTNCLAPLVKVLDDAFGITKAVFTTVHPYTNNQMLHDSPHPDLRRARGGARSIIPTTTTAVQALFQVMPSFSGRLDGMALRVPTAVVANIDLVAELKGPISAVEVNDAFRNAADGNLAGILGVTDEELVSCDFRGCRYSSLLDATLTQVVDGNLVRILAWYDNEAGYSNRLIDLIGMVGRSAS
jgi:glyceraldehyde 3-phosphate dehydrogenase